MTITLQKMKGFTLVEIAVVLTIIGILVSGFLFGIGEQQKTKYQLESEEKLVNIKKQLLKFVLINKYLPCPDINRNGYENRVSVAPGAECSADFGGVPYLDLGIKENDALDSWHNPIRYAINRNADVSADICDSTKSSSYFCNDLSINDGRAFFTLDTPPVSGNNGVGNYTVCNESASSCTGTPSDSHLLTNIASIVLASYGENADDSMIDSSPNCSGLSGASAENCDADQYYHQKTISHAEGNEFDDLIEYITGYEIKSTVLSPVTVWKNVSLIGIPPATFRNYELDEGDYAPLVGDENDDDSATHLQDVIVIDQDISTALDLGKGDDYVLIGHDLSSGLEYDNKTGIITDYGSDADLNAGPGDDNVYIVNDAFSEIDLGSGDDRFVIGGDLHDGLIGGEGDDKAWLQGDYSEGTEVETTETSTETVTGDPVSIEGSPYSLGWGSGERYGTEAEARAAGDGENWILVDTDADTDSEINGNVETITETTIQTYQDEYYYTYFWGSYYTRRNEKTVTTTTTTTITTTTTTITSIKGGVDMGSGNDVVWLGNTEDSSSGRVNNSIDGGDGFDTLVLENVDQWNDLSSVEQNNINNFELIVFSANEDSGARSSCEWGSCEN